MSSILEFKGIVKRFPGVLALDRINFIAKSGEVTALVGENGAGKSTLLKVLNGDYQPEEGQYLINGEQRHFASPQEAISAGVSIIYQERQIIPALTVAENVFMEAIPVLKSKLIDFKTLNLKTQKIIDEFKLPFKATDKVKDLSVAFQQMVEIMKAYRRNPKIIAFDEPSASLSDAEIETLFQIIEKLKKKDLIILYVSHRMNEIFQITDQVVIMKDGKYVEQIATKDTNEMEIVKKMVGRNLGDIFNNIDRNHNYGDVLLEVKNLVADNVKNVSFTLREGEVLGFSGLVGAGRSETMRAIFGADKISSGEIYFKGKKVKIKQPKQAIDLGIGFCPEDRKYDGIVGIQPIYSNVSMAIMEKVAPYFFIKKKKENTIAKQQVENLNVKTPSIKKPIGELSGGNQQKVILGRWLATNPKILILDEPTKGIDVGAKSEIYQLICDLAKQGIGVIMISSELPEVMGVSDRIIVMCEGKITGEVKREDATDEKLLTLAMQDMLGGKKVEKTK